MIRATASSTPALLCVLLLVTASCGGPAAAVRVDVTDAAASADGGGDASLEASGDAAATDVTVDAAPACALDATYVFGGDGGLVVQRDESRLTPPASYERVRQTVTTDATLSCAPTLPSCGDATRIDASDIVRDLADAEVQAALSAPTPPVYGFDTRPGDGVIFKFQRADGRGFFAGADCDAGSFCHGAVPAGIARLEADLKALDTQQLADPSCAALR